MHSTLFAHLQVDAGDAQIESEAYGEFYQLSGFGLGRYLTWPVCKMG